MMREQVLERLVKQHGWTLGAELGLWQGRTIGHLLDTCPGLTMIGVDIFCNIGVKEYMSWDHEDNRNRVYERVRAHPGRGVILETLTTRAAEFIKDACLDFVFIDADHSEEAVLRDIELWAPKVKPRGFIMGHDIGWPTVQLAVRKALGEVSVLDDNVWLRRNVPFSEEVR